MPAGPLDKGKGEIYVNCCYCAFEVEWNLTSYSDVIFCDLEINVMSSSATLSSEFGALRLRNGGPSTHTNGQTFFAIAEVSLAIFEPVFFSVENLSGSEEALMNGPGGHLY